MKKYILLILIFKATLLVAQSDSTKKLTVSGYAELYYSYDFSKPSNHEKPNFIYNHKRHNEVNLNLAYAKASYNDNTIRGNLALMFGNYPEYNLSAEPKWAQFIYEANAGVKISRTQNVWLDAGIMPSHIGFESAVSADCWTVTRSILAENSPYYETGIKLSYTNKNEKLSAALLVLNGWQKIRRPDFIQQPSFGLQLTYKPSPSLTLNYSNFIGSDKPDSLNATRTFHNFYMQYDPGKKFAVITGFDIGRDKYNAEKYGAWLSPVAILRYKANNKSRIALRGEYYNDPNHIIITKTTPGNIPDGFKVLGLSVNFDYQVNSKALFRIEGKTLRSKYPFFNNNSKQNLSITSSLSVKL
jgi:hypothetical protein